MSPGPMSPAPARRRTGMGTLRYTANMSADGYTVVSGGAFGIDAAAHRAALAREGTTVASMAGGVDRFYPSGHDALLARIVEAGSFSRACWLSRRAPDSPRRFPAASTVSSTARIRPLCNRGSDFREAAAADDAVNGASTASRPSSHGG